jgi:hypothetical protein
MSIVVTVHNSDLADLFVTINDLNQAGSPAIVQSQRLNEDDIFQIAVQEGDDGSTGDIQWTVVRVDDPTATAQRTVEVSAADSVDVTTHFE